MLSSITGQNERWAQLAASQTTPAAQSSQAAGGANAYLSAALSPKTGSGAVTGDTSSPISDGTNFALMAFGGSSQFGGSTSGSIASGGTSALSQVLTDLQSLLSSISGTPSSAGSSGTSGASLATDADASTVRNSGTTAGTLSQDLAALSTDLGGLASALGGTHRGDHDGHARGAPPDGPPPGSSDILNSGTASASAAISNSATASASTSSAITNTGTAGNGWATFMQQFAAGAYGSGYDSSASSSLMAINA